MRYVNLEKGQSLILQERPRIVSYWTITYNARLKQKDACWLSEERLSNVVSLITLD